MRAIKNKLMSDAIIEGYGTLLFSGRFPFAIINLEIEPRLVDVNLHPQKTEIKFVNEKEVFNQIKEKISSRLRKSQLIYNVSNTQEFKNLTKKINNETFKNHKNDVENNIEKEKETEETLETLNSPIKKIEKKHKYFTKESQQTIEIENSTIPKSLNIETNNVKKKYKLIGQFNMTYLLIEENKGNLLILDQHAAHERILYEFFSNKMNDVGKQDLLTPHIINLSPSEFAKADELIKSAEKYGFEIEHYGPQSLAIRSVPVILGKSLEPKHLKDAILESNRLTQKISEKNAHNRVATMACRTAIKAGDILSESFMRRIVDKIYTLDMNSTCPHGRPTALRMSPYDFEKLFKRKI